MSDLPPFPKREPSTVEECDEAIAYWSALSQASGLPVINSDGSDAIDALLDLRSTLGEG